MDLFKFFSARSSSKSVAKDRLKLILIHDRSNVSPELLELIKNDILMVLAKYVDIDSEEIDVKLVRTDASQGNAPALIANIPIKGLKLNR